jgi:hypothetical protein
MKPTLLLLALLAAASSLQAKGIESIEWRDRAAWNCATTIAVRPFVQRGGEGNANAPDESMAYFVSELAAHLVGHNGITKVALAPPDQPIAADLVLTGVFVTLGPVQHQGRAIFGNATPTSKCSLHLRAYRADEESPVFELSATREEPLSNLDPTGLASIESVATDIAGELLRKRGACDASGLALVVAKPYVPPPPVVVPPAPAPVVPAPVAIASPAVAPASSALDVTVTIESNVPDAEVTIDGHFAGNTPIPAYHLPSGTHTINVTAPGYTTWHRELTVTSGSVTRVKAMLGKR